jgi:hypothetical protein
MSDTMFALVESLLFISAITAGIVWYAVAAGKKS